MSGLAAAIPENVKDLLTSGLARPCSYGGSRPGCQLLAVVRYGPAALCAACDQRRSTLGKGQARCQQVLDILRDLGSWSATHDSSPIA